MELISENLAHGGVQGVYSHRSTVLNCDMTFAVFTPPQVADGPCPVLWYLSGLTCTHANVMDKGEYRRLAAELGLIVVCPDTSPRGEGVADEPDNWQFGCGAGFYLDATEAPYAANYQMYSYITQELTELVAEQFPVDMTRQGITGHSMGGHGALTIALKNPERFKSLSAFAPIAQPTTAEWSAPALEKYLGAGDVQRQYDAVALLDDGARFAEALIDQGGADNFLKWLRPDLLEEASKRAGLDWTIRIQDGYDHSYYFISSFMEAHLRWHAQRLG